MHADVSHGGGLPGRRAPNRIPSRAAQGVPDIQCRSSRVVRVTQSQVEGIIADTDTVRRL